MEIKFDETIYIPTRLAIPMRRKGKIILPMEKLLFEQTLDYNDKALLLKYCSESELQHTLNKLQSKKMNPLTNRIFKYEFLYFLLFLLIFILVTYTYFLIVFLFVINPLIIFAFGLFEYKILQKTILNLVDNYRRIKIKSLKDFLNEENQRYYVQKNLLWSVDDNAKWILIEIKKGLVSGFSSAKDRYKETPEEC
jgi:hypothetical protein